MSSRSIERDSTRSRDPRRSTQHESTSRLRRRGLLVGTCASLSPTDPTHQKCRAYLPNKLKEWDNFRPGHVQENTWTMEDTAHLDEVQSMTIALAAVHSRGDMMCDWEYESMIAWWEHHYEWVFKRAERIRTYWIPLVEARFHYPQALKDALDNYIEALHSVSTMVYQINVVGDDGSALLNEWKAYEEKVFAYNAYNDNMGVMLYHAYFSPEEDENNVKGWYDRAYNKEKTLVKEGRSSRKSPGCAAALIHNVGEDVFRNVIMPREKFPAMMWDYVFCKKYQEYVDNIAVHIDGLLSGVPPIFTKAKGRRKTFKIGLENFLSLDPLDPDYQKDARFPPNKLKEWGETLTSQIENSVLTLTHHAYKSSSTKLKNALHDVQRRGPLAEWELTSIRKVFSHHRQMCRHEFKRSIQIPFMETRIRLPPIFKDSLDAVAEDLDTISDLIDALSVGEKVDEILHYWSSYDELSAFVLHIHDPMYLMLYHTYFSRKEQNALLLKTLDEGYWNHSIGGFIYHIGKDNFRRFLMAQEKVSDLSWHIKYFPKYVEYLEDIVVHVEALEKGTPPTVTERRGVAKLLSYFETNLSEECLDSKKSPSTEGKKTRLSNLVDSLYTEFGKEL